MLVKFKKSTDFNDRHYARGDMYEFDAKTASQLIADGVAVDPEAKKAAKEAEPEIDAAPKTASHTKAKGK